MHSGLPETSEFQKSYKCHCFLSKFQFSKNYRISQQGLLFHLGAGCLKFLILASWTNTKPQLGSPSPQRWKPEAKREGREIKENQMPAAKFCLLWHFKQTQWSNSAQFHQDFQWGAGSWYHSQLTTLPKKEGEAESHRTVAPRKVNYLTLFHKQQKHNSEFWYPFLQFNAKFVNSTEWDAWLNTYLLINSSSLKVSFLLKAYLLPNNYCSSTAVWPFWIMKILWNISILSTVSIHDGAILVYFNR